MAEKSAGKTDEFAGVKMPRSPVYGSKGMVVSGHSLSSIAGLRMLERGGAVVDAMIACSAVLATVLPHAATQNVRGGVVECASTRCPNTGGAHRARARVREVF